MSLPSSGNGATVALEDQRRKRFLRFKVGLTPVETVVCRRIPPDFHRSVVLRDLRVCYNGTSDVKIIVW